MKKWFHLLCILLFFLLLTAACSNNEQTAAKDKDNAELTVSAAASLKDALEEIKHTYEKEHPEVRLQFNFGGSGSLQQQISQGAPVDLFFSAAEDKFAHLVENGLIKKEDGTALLGNSLVLVVPKDDAKVQDFADLAEKDIATISIGTPETVPAGMYAKEALEQMGLWEDVQEKIVYAKDVRQVLSYVETGNVEAGIVYKTDALASDKVDIIATAPAETHSSIIYPVGIIADSKRYEAAKAFYEYVQSNEALKVFEKYGFTAQ